MTSTSLESLEVASPRLFATSARLATFLKDASLAELGGARLTLRLERSSEPLGITMASEPNEGARICTVAAGSRAEVAGLRSGDRIATINGKPATSAINAKDLIERRAGKPLELEIVRPREVTEVRSVRMLERRVLRAPLGASARRRNESLTLELVNGSAPAPSQYDWEWGAPAGPSDAPGEGPPGYDAYDDFGGADLDASDDGAGPSSAACDTPLPSGEPHDDGWDGSEDDVSRSGGGGGGDGDGSGGGDEGEAGSDGGHADEADEAGGGGGSGEAEAGGSERGEAIPHSSEPDQPVE